MITHPTSSGDVYDRLARAYGCLTSGYEHDRWLDELVGLARASGLGGRTALDVACGTGSTMMPLLRMGFEVVGVDRSRGMLEVAEHRLDGAARLHRADMRCLPRLGTFALVMCIGDSLNHLLGGRDIERALAGMARNLAPGGLLLFDLNTLSTLRTVFSTNSVSVGEQAMIVWNGTGDPHLPSGGVTSAELVVIDLTDGAPSTPERLTIEERHHSLELMLDRLWRAGLEPVALRGTEAGGRIVSTSPDEAVHHKLVIVARRPAGLSAWTYAHRIEGG